jgi:hypothetical protein
LKPTACETSSVPGPDLSCRPGASTRRRECEIGRRRKNEGWFIFKMLIINRKGRGLLETLAETLLSPRVFW